MATAAENRRMREDVLIALYEVTDAGSNLGVTAGDVAGHLGIDYRTLMKSLDVLNGQGLGGQRTMGGADGKVKITPEGILAAEELIDEREAAAPALVLSSATVADLEPILMEIRQALGDLEHDLDDDQRAEGYAQLDTIQMQLRSPAPDRTIVERSLTRLRDFGYGIAVGVAGNAAYQALGVAVASALQLVS